MEKTMILEAPRCNRLIWNQTQYTGLDLGTTNGGIEFFQKCDISKIDPYLSAENISIYIEHFRVKIDFDMIIHKPDEIDKAFNPGANDLKIEFANEDTLGFINMNNIDIYSIEKGMLINDNPKKFKMKIKAILKGFAFDSSSVIILSSTMKNWFKMLDVKLYV